MTSTPPPNLTMGRAKLLSGAWEESGPWFERCTVICPNNALAYYNLGLRAVITQSDPNSKDLAMQALSLSPIDPLQYAFLATRAFGHVAAGELDEAVEWADKAAIAPRAHHLIVAIAAAVNGMAGNEERRREWLATLKARYPAFEPEQFPRSFPIRDEGLKRRFVEQLH